MVFPVIPKQFFIFLAEGLLFLHGKGRNERKLFPLCPHINFVFSAAFRKIYVSAEIFSRKFIPQLMYHIRISVHEKDPPGGKTLQKRGDLRLISMCRKTYLFNPAADRICNAVQSDFPFGSAVRFRRFFQQVQKLPPG